MILNFNEYMKSCYEHLLSKTSNNQAYYKQVEAYKVDEAKSKIETTLKDMLNSNIITRQEFNAMCPKDKVPGRFYANFKVHKAHTPMKSPPVRPILSGSGSITEGIATFVAHHIKQSSISHDTYLQDTPAFLRLISRINKGPKLSSNALLVTWNVDGLYTNIQHEDGLQTLQEQLEERNNPKVPSKYIIKLMKLILNHNIFTFHDAHWIQEIGAAMGSKPVPHYADGFMARQIDPQIIQLASRFDTNNQKAMQVLKRFLDDYFSIHNGTTKELHLLLDLMNKIHPSIKLTMSTHHWQKKTLKINANVKKHMKFPS